VSLVLANLTGNWQPWIPAAQTQNMLNGGYFVTSVSPSLDVYSVNSMYFYNQNNLTVDCNQPGSLGLQHLRWLNTTLAQTSNRGARAILTGHVPPSDQLWFPNCYIQYVQLSRAFQNTIVGHLYAHTHAVRSVRSQRRMLEISLTFAYIRINFLYSARLPRALQLV
jgi:endopolyphosphatase